MNIFSKHELAILLLGIAIMLGVARLAGEFFRKIKLPIVVGEIIAGIVIGPSVFGYMFPEAFEYLFNGSQKIRYTLDGIIQISMVFLLLIAGMEVDLSSVLRQGKTVMRISFFTIIIPFAMGILAVLAAPSIFGASHNPMLALFMGIAISITALPIVAKILIETKLIQSDFGVIVLASALINDLVGWILFSMMIGIAETGSATPATVIFTAVLAISLAIFIITAVRWIVNTMVLWLQAHTEWPGGIISFTIIICLIFAAISEAIGVHAIFGAFLAGVAIGDSPHLRNETRNVISQFVNNIFTPLFFVSIGMAVHLTEDFNLILTLFILALVFAGKISGSAVGGTLSRMAKNEYLALGFAMSATGTMQIILGFIALQYNIIARDLFTSLVITAIITSLVAAPLMKKFIKTATTMDILELFHRQLFLFLSENIRAEEAIEILSQKAALKTKLAATEITLKVLEREAIMSTGIGCGIAVPHAQIHALPKPLIAVGVSRSGVDFNSPDGKPAHLIFLILTPHGDTASQIQILAQISNIFLDERVRNESMNATSFNEFIAVIKNAIFTQNKSA